MHTSLTALIGQSLTAIDTPALVIDLDAMQRNLRAMQTFATAHGMLLRPHAKMHKSAALALLQMQVGAVGVCVQKPSEAAALVAAGVTNVYVSNEIISLQKCELLTLLNKGLTAQNGKVSVAVDSLLGIGQLARAMATHGGTSRMDVYVEIDVGQARCGVPPGEAVLPLVRAIAQHNSLRFAGLQAYHGRAQHLRSVQERREAIAAVVADVQRTKTVLEAAGFTVPLVTGAGSGTFSYEAASGVFGELQAGSYLFMDADYAANEADPQQPRFEHALFVKSQVMSVSSSFEPRAVVDAGHKSHAIDSGLPKLWAGHQADWRYVSCSDEHGILQGTQLPALGDTVWLIPGHCDPTVNLHNYMIGVRGGLAQGVVEQIIRVDARGALT
jgi:D-serine deaminase-like pyridoxal phosphate-dependent protein